MIAITQVHRHAVRYSEQKFSCCYSLVAFLLLCSGFVTSLAPGRITSPHFCEDGLSFGMNLLAPFGVVTSFGFRFLRHHFTSRCKNSGMVGTSAGSVLEDGVQSQLTGNRNAGAATGLPQP